MSKLNKFIVDKNGQWAHPGKLTAVPTKDGRITMEGVPYPVMGFVPGQPPIMMQPGGKYQFPGKMVYEIPMAQSGGDISIPDLSDKGWLSKYQEGGVKTFGSRLEYIDEPDGMRIREKGTEEWKELDSNKSQVLKNLMAKFAPKANEPQDYVDKWLSSLGVSETKKPAAPKPAASKPVAKNPAEEPTNLVENPAMAEIAPELYSLVSGVDIPKTKEIEKRREVNKYAASPEFFVAPYKDEDEAVNAYKQTADFNLRHKNASDYTPDDIIKVQSYLDGKGYYPETKKIIKVEDYQTPEQVIELQKYLANEGLLEVLGVTGENIDGNLSGKIDKQTLNAIRQYNMYNQKYNSGQLDNNTKDAIRAYKNKIDAKSTLGISVRSPFELYDPQTGEPDVGLTNQSMQDFEKDLMKRGFFTGNVKYDFNLKPSDIKIGYNFSIDPNQDYDKTEDAKVKGQVVRGCAQYINGTVCSEDVVGEEAREELGFKGDAWTLSENLQNKGGKLLFTGLPERSQIPLSPKAGENEIKNYLKSTLNNDAVKGQLREMLNTGNIKPGDVVNIFYEGSPSTKKAWNQTQPLNNRFFTTHVGIVKADKDGKLYVEHNVHGDLQKQPVEDFIEGKVPGNSKSQVSLIAGITRPNYFDGVDNDGRIPAGGISYYQTEYGQFKPEGALANQADWAGQSISGENTHKFLSVIEKNKDSILKDIPITENEFGKLMRVARIIPTRETYAGKNYEKSIISNVLPGPSGIVAGAVAKGLQDALMPEREKSMGITSLKDETNINPQLRSKLYESDYELTDPVKAGLPTFYVLSKNYLYLKEVANEYGLDMTSDQLAKLAGISYNQSIGKVAAQLIEQGGYDNYINYRRANASKGDGKFQYHEAVDLYDKQTMQYGGWLNKYQGNEGSSQVKPTSNFTLPSLDPQAQQSADYAKGWDEYNKGVEQWTDLLAEKERKKGRSLTTEEKQRWLQKAVRKADGRKTEVDPNDPKWNFLFKDSYQTYDPEFGPMTVMTKPVEYQYNLTDLDKKKQKIAAKTREGEMTPFAKSLGMNPLDPRVQKRASQNANDQVALEILGNKPQGDRTRVEWLNSLTPEERSTIERSQYAGKLDPDFTSQFSQGLEKNLRNAANIAAVGPIDWYQGNNLINQPLWTNSDYTQEEAANASAMGMLAPLSYPTNLVTGAITGDFGSALQGQRSKPLFTDYRQPEYAAAMSNLYEAGYDPLNAVGIGLLEGTNIAENAARAGKYLTTQTPLQYTYKINPTAKGSVFTPLEGNMNYRYVNQAGYDDALKTFLVRANPIGDNSVFRRPTEFPSFSKGKPAEVFKSTDSTPHYLMQSDVPMYSRGEINPVTGQKIVGRHAAARPIDPETGEVLQQLDLEDINAIYEAKPNWLTGYKRVYQSPKNIDVTAVRTGPNIATDGAFNKGVYELPDYPGYLLKYESPEQVSQYIPEFMDIDLSQMQKNIKSPNVGKVVNQQRILSNNQKYIPEVPNENISALADTVKDNGIPGSPKSAEIITKPDILNAYIMRRMEGKPLYSLPTDKIINIPTDAWTQYAKDYFELAQNRSAIDNAGSNVFYDDASNSFKFIDLSPAVTPKMSNHWVKNIGNINPTVQEETLKKLIRDGILGQIDKNAEYNTLSMLSQNMNFDTAKNLMETISFVSDLTKGDVQKHLIKAGYKYGGWLQKYQDGNQVNPELAKFMKQPVDTSDIRYVGNQQAVADKTSVATPKPKGNPVEEDAALNHRIMTAYTKKTPKGFVARQVPGALGSMQTVYENPQTGERILPGGEAEVQQAIMDRREDANKTFNNIIFPTGAGAFYGLSNIASGNLAEGALELAGSLPIPFLKGSKGSKTKQLPDSGNVDDLVDLWRIQERGARPMSELAAEGKLGPMFQNEKAIQHFKDREKYFGQWFTKDKADFDFYKADREFVDPEIIQLQVPKSRLAEFQNYDKSLSRAADREFVIPLDQQKLFTPTQLPGSANKFKSEIDWGKWNSEIPSNKALMDEYHAIEQTTKADGSWMKNPDGSPFKGTPEQFVQQNSENFKKAFGNSKLVNSDGSFAFQYHGGKVGYEQFLTPQDKGYIKRDTYTGDQGIYFTPSKSRAESYSRNTPKNEREIYQTYINMEKPYSGRVKGTYGNDQITNEQLNELLKNNYDGILDKNIFPYHRQTIVFDPKNIKSAIGNNGMFDMTNPNIYKALVPAAIGTGAAAVIAGQDTPQQKDGGWINKYQKGGSNPEYYDIQSEMNNIRKNYETEYADIQRFKQNLLDSGESHFMDNVPFCTVLPNGQQYCATRATEALRKSGYPVKQISSGRKLKDELTPDKGWYPTKYENLEAGDVAMIERPGYWHTMVSSGNVSNVDSRIRRNATDTQKGFFYDSGSGKDWTFEIPKDEEELANWMNPKTMNYYSYQGKLPELESQYADYHNQLKALPFPYIQPRAPQPLQVPQPVLQNNQKQEFEKGGSLSKNKYINSVTLSNTSSWLNKYK
jgi:hypothetical protein